VVFSDLDVSGAKVAERHRYVEMVRGIEDGSITTVVAYDLSRLHRNAGESDRFWKLIASKGTPVYLTDMTVDPRSATGRMIIGMFAQINAWTSEVTSEKIRASLARREQETGKRNGGVPYPNPRVVVDAYAQTGSLTRAARKLNEDGVPTRNARSRGWTASAVRSIVGREAPDLIVPGESRGRPNSRPFRFARLLRCSECGGRLTPSYDTRTDYVSYYCPTANVQPHGRKRVPETALVAAIQPEADRWITRARRVPVEGDPRAAAKLDALERQVEQLAASGLDVSSLRADLDAKRAALAPGRWVKRFSLGELSVAGDLGGDPATVNDFVRRAFERVVVDMSGEHERGQASVVEFAWRDASLRAEGIAS
jgi:DNA invertase Pin-like site-specific DNA recombinase